jgi:hypothetical protein
MIKFFRKIRQNLLSEGKTGKYFKYAIGEIILVVIGILIALSINNWNQERVSKDKAYSYLNQISKDLSLDLQYYKIMINALSERSIIYDEFGKNNNVDDSLLVKLGGIITDNFDSRDFGPSYRSFVNSGDIDLIQNKVLVNELQLYYSMATKSLNDMSEYQNTFNIHNIEGRLLETLDLETDGSYSLQSLKKEMISGNLSSIANWQNKVTKSLISTMEICQKSARALQQKINEIEKTKG